jgi:hypothetical protein
MPTEINYGIFGLKKIRNGKIWDSKKCVSSEWKQDREWWVIKIMKISDKN